MRSERVIALAIAAGLVLACGRGKVPKPGFADGGMLAHAKPLSGKQLASLEGMYAATARFGSTAALHATKDTLSIFGDASAAYAILKGGCLDDGRAVFEGTWRHPDADEAGLVRLFADGVCGKDEPKDVTITGATGDDYGPPGQPITLTFDHDLKRTPRFAVAAHHGACRTIDDCGASENSLESIKLSEAFGADIVEIDVRVTRDGTPFLFHDEWFGPRLTNGTFCHGSVDEMTFDHVRALCTLKYGEQIPSLDEALTTSIDETHLKGVWLDMKVKEAVEPTLKSMERAIAHARAVNREIRIVIGLPEDEVLDAYLALPHPEGGGCLVELDPSDVRRAGCQYWAPRWTRGPMADDAAALQADGHAVTYWTIDEKEFIDLFLTEASPNAILSDRPGLVFHRFQTIGKLPPESSKL